MKNPGQPKILFPALIMLLAVSSISCRLMSSSTPPTEPSSSVEHQLPEGKTQRLVIEDDFSDPDSGWLATSEDDKGGSYANGEYVVWADKTGTKMAELLKLGELSDFVFEIDSKKVSGEKGSFCFVFYRMHEYSDWYAFGITDDSEYSVVKYEAGQATAMLKNWTRSGYIKGGNATNRFKVACIGTQTNVYVNGYKLATVTDNTTLTGQIGLGIKSFSESGAKYSFDNFRLYAIQ